MVNNTEQFNPDGYYREPEPRKATDILLALENKIDTLQKLVFNQDMLLKLIADKSNKIYAYINELQKEYSQSEQNQEQLEDDTPRIINITNKDQIVEAKNIDIGSRRINRVPSDAQVQQPAIIAIPNTPSEKTQQPSVSTGNKKVPVIQRVSDPTGKDLFMATVNILDENGNEIHKTKTNAAGKWQATLKPGEYEVKITKTDTTSKKILEGIQKIKVPASNSTFTLPVVIIQR
jgi:hypothetical protein